MVHFVGTLNVTFSFILVYVIRLAFVICVAVTVFINRFLVSLPCILNSEMCYIEINAVCMIAMNLTNFVNRLGGGMRRLLKQLGKRR